MNATNSTDESVGVNQSVVIVLGSVTAVVVLVNVACVVMGLKVLKKTLHNLLILTLCFSDAFLGFSGCLRILGVSSSFRFLQTNVDLCILQRFLPNFGLLLNYVILLLLCIQRYVLLRTNGFGNTVKKLESKKYQIVLGTFIVILVYQLASSLLLPLENNILICDSKLYGDHEIVFACLFIIPTTILTLINIFFYLLVSRMVLKRFFKPTIQPIEQKDTGMNKTNELKNIEISNTSNAPSSSCDLARGNTKSENICSIRFEPRETVVVEINPVLPLNMSSESIRSDETERQIKSSDIIDEVNFDNIDTDSTECPSSYLDIPDTEQIREIQSSPSQTRDQEHTNRCFDQIDVELDTVKPRKNTHVHINEIDIEFDTDVTIAQSHYKPQRNAPRHKWEMHVFVTCLILAVQTMVLTMPVVISLWYGMVSNTPFGLQTKFFIGIPFLLNSLIDPFIFTWRITEIRQGFCRMFQKQN